MKKKKVLIIIVCIVFVLFGGANVYASIKGYGNVINLVKNMVEKKEEKEKNETIEIITIIKQHIIIFFFI